MGSGGGRGRAGGWWGVPLVLGGLFFLAASAPPSRFWGGEMVGAP